MTERLLAGQSITAERLASIGDIYASLLADPEWISRRVETIALIDSTRIDRHITLDVLPGLVQQRFAKLPRANGGRTAGTGGYDRIPVPLTILEKGLLLDIDLRSEDGRSLPLLNSGEDSLAALSLLTSAIQTHTGLLDHPEIVNFIVHAFALSRHIPDVPSFMTKEQYFEQVWQADADDPLLAGLTRVLLANDRVRERAELLTFSYLAMTEIPVTDSVLLLKLRLREDGPNLDMPIMAKLRLQAATLDLENSSMSFAARTHVRVDAPAGTVLTSLEVSETSLPPRVGSYHSRLSPERAILYGSQVAEGERVLSLGLVPQSKRFDLLGAFCALTGFIVLFAGAQLQVHSNDFLTKFGNSNLDVLVAGLLALPPIYSIYLSRAGEHDIRTLLLRLPRAAIVMVGLAQLTAGAALVVQGLMTKTQLAHIWEYSSYVCAVIAAYVGVCACRSWAMRRDSEKSRGLTFNTLGLPRDLQ